MDDYNKQHKETRSERNRRNYLKRKQQFPNATLKKLRDYQTKRRQENRDEYNEYNRQYREQHLTELREYHTEYNRKWRAAQRRKHSDGRGKESPSEGSNNCVDD